VPGIDRLTEGGPPQAAQLTTEDVRSSWADLAGDDAKRAYRAIQSLAVVPESTLRLLEARLQPAAPADAQRIAQLVRDLNSEMLTVRERAVRELEELRELAEPDLRQAAAGKLPPEAHRRVEALLEKIEPFPSGEQLRQWRALEVLELIGTPPARKLLEKLAGGAPGARQTQEAKAVLARLSRRPTSGPRQSP